jgi:hypothetical protein
MIRRWTLREQKVRAKKAISFLSDPSRKAAAEAEFSAIR